MRNKTETVMDQKDRAMRGWLGEPQPKRDHDPSHRFKWHKMMGATHLLPEEEKEAIRQEAQLYAAETGADHKKRGSSSSAKSVGSKTSSDSP